VLLLAFHLSWFSLNESISPGYTGIISEEHTARALSRQALDLTRLVPDR